MNRTRSIVRRAIVAASCLTLLATAGAVVVVGKQQRAEQHGSSRLTTPRDGRGYVVRPTQLPAGFEPLSEGPELQEPLDSVSEPTLVEVYETDGQHVLRVMGSEDAIQALIPPVVGEPISGGDPSGASLSGEYHSSETSVALAVYVPDDSRSGDAVPQGEEFHDLDEEEWAEFMSLQENVLDEVYLTASDATGEYGDASSASLGVAVDRLIATAIEVRSGSTSASSNSGASVSSMIATGDLSPLTDGVEGALVMRYVSAGADLTVTTFPQEDLDDVLQYLPEATEVWIADRKGYVLDYGEFGVRSIVMEGGEGQLIALGVGTDVVDDELLEYHAELQEMIDNEPKESRRLELEELLAEMQAELPYLQSPGADGPMSIDELLMLADGLMPQDLS